MNDGNYKGLIVRLFNKSNGLFKLVTGLHCVDYEAVEKTRQLLDYVKAEYSMGVSYHKVLNSLTVEVKLDFY